MAYPFVQAVHTSTGNNLPIVRIVIHGTVSKTVAGGAMGNARYFQSQASGGSAQYVVDPTAIVQCVKDNVIAWHAPPNIHSIGVEFCDWVTLSAAVKHGDKFWIGKTEAQFAARWSLPEWDKMLRLGAGLIKALCIKYGVPQTHIGVAQLLRGVHGITPHSDVSGAWHQTNHTDPGFSFPWAKLMAYITGSVIKPPVNPPAKGYVLQDCKNMQAAVKSTVDGKWRLGTDKNAVALHSAIVGRAFNVILVQQIIGVKADGAFGPVSRAALEKKVHQLQTVLKILSDGHWGPISEMAFAKIRTQFLNR